MTIPCLAVGLAAGCGDDAGAPHEDPDGGASTPACIDPDEAYPISRALVPGSTSSAFYDTVSPTEYADIQRTHIHRADFYGGQDGEETTVTVRQLMGVHENAYNLVTRDRDEAFLYGTDPEPYVVKFDLTSGQVVWRTELPVLEDNFIWVGLVAVHGNGDIYAVHSRTLVRLSPESGDILARADLPPPSGSAARDTVYNGFTIAPSGVIVGKSYGRPAGCTESGTAAIINCVDDDNPQPPSRIVTLDPETLEMLSSAELPEVATGRPAVAQFGGREYVYLNGADNVYRLRLDGNDIVLDTTWLYGGFLTEGETGSSSVVVMGDWVTFQTNGTPSRAPMSVHVVSQADAGRFVRREPFSAPPMTSFTPSSVTADPVSMSIYSQDGGRGQIARLDFDEANLALTEAWVIDQRTINHLTLIGPPEKRVLVSTEAPQAAMGFITGRTDYDEQLVWRSAEDAKELARSEILPAMFYGGPVNPGFDGTQFYLGLDGRILELSTSGPVPVCE
ncbi:MAG: hypothetical protein AAFZ18_27680 [Myxococcota bacterium]